MSRPRRPGPPRVSPGRAHAEWLRLVDPSGPFLTVPVLFRAFPDGLDRLDGDERAEMRGRLAEVLALPDDPAARTAWIEWVLAGLLGWDGHVRSGPGVPDALTHVVTDRQIVLRPDHSLLAPPADLLSGGEQVRACVWTWPHRTVLTSRVPGDPWPVSPVDRASLVSRANGVPISLVTNGLDWVVVWAEPGRATGWATFPAGLFGEEPVLADAFTSVCGMKRFCGVAPDEQLERLLVASASAQAEVTDTLGSQVRKAAELLVTALGEADRKTEGALLAGVDAKDVYAAAVAVLMRLVVLFSAEELGLLPLGDDLYDSTLAASTLLDDLAGWADRDGDELLDSSTAAWHRLLAVFRAVHGGITHDRLRSPAYGGALFDPDRYPFLEGRPPGTSWRTTPAQPVPVDDLTVLAILRALQELSMKVPGGGRETRRLSYRTLDVEQIGHVYEGLLDHSAVRATEIILGLIGQDGREPEVPLTQLAARAALGRDALLACLKDQTGLSVTALGKALDRAATADDDRRLGAALDNAPTLVGATRGWVGLLRLDLRDLPLVIRPGSLFVTQTGAKRDSGTAYTTRDLADEIVLHTLQPLCYEPGPATEPDPAKWRLKSAEEILDLKVCDPAVGSGAILVAACRYLADRLQEAWAAEGTADRYDAEMLPLEARRHIVERCLYAVDRDPMAVEMAKLSLWLVTMAKDRPFTFVDHAIRTGDSLLGITTLDQLRAFHMDPTRGYKKVELGVDWSSIDRVVKEAIDRRRRLSAIPVLTVRDAELKARLAAEADGLLSTLTLIADVIIGAALSTTKGAVKLDDRLAACQALVGLALDDDPATASLARTELAARARQWLDAGKPAGAPNRHPLHWALAFPEVIADGGAFDAIVGNPPFLGGQRLTGATGTDFREHAIRWIAGGVKGSADLVAYFFLRAAQVSRASDLR